MTTPVTPASLDDERELSDALLERYWLDEASAEDTVRIDTWFARHPEQRARYETLYQGIKAGRWTPFTPDATAQRVVGILGAAGMIGQRPSQAPMTKRAPGHRVRYLFAGAVAGVLVLAFALRTEISRFATPKTAPGVSTYTTGNGERATVTLPDGSTVLLNVASRLDVPVNYGAGNRTLHLTGEALFTVAHNAGSAFTVVAGPSVTRVLGTVFAIRHYNTDSLAIVTVREGKVMVRSRVLVAEQQVAVSERGVSEIQPVNPARFGFVTGVLTFNDVALRDAIPELNRWYDADIRLGDTTLGSLPIVGGFKRGSITDLTTLLGMTKRVHIERHGRVITLYPRD